ncbi:MAG: hypothetical protein QM722_15560 [Piscinibacter sp.]
MWLLFARAPPPDVQVWPGRRALAFVDAVAWPVGLAALILSTPFPSGVMGMSAVAFCAVEVFRRGYRAIFQNHRYHFTTWHWGRRLAFVVAFGYALKLAVMLSA